MVRLQERLQSGVAGLTHTVHHPVGPDGDDAVDFVQLDHGSAESSLSISDHRLDNISAIMRILQPRRNDLHSCIGRPDDLVSSVLDLLTLKEICSILVSGEVNNLVLVFP